MVSVTISTYILLLVVVLVLLPWYYYRGTTTTNTIKLDTTVYTTQLHTLTVTLTLTVNSGSHSHSVTHTGSGTVNCVYTTLVTLHLQSTLFYTTVHSTLTLTVRVTQ